MRARQAEGFWREVRVYDADDLETWLESASAVHVWLSILLGNHPEVAADIEIFWTLPVFLGYLLFPFTLQAARESLHNDALFQRP